MDTELEQLAKTDRNPVQESRYQELLREAQASNGSTSSNNFQPLSAPDLANLRGQVYDKLKPYYLQLAKEAQGDFTRAVQILHEDYAKGTRQARVNYALTQKYQTADLENALAALGISFKSEQEKTIDDLNNRGMATYQMGPNGEYNVLKPSTVNPEPGELSTTSNIQNPANSNLGRGGYELSQLQKDQKLRQEAEQRAKIRPLEEAGIQLKQFTNIPEGINPNQSPQDLAKSLSASGVDRSKLGSAEQGLVRGTEQQTRELQKTQEDLANQRSQEVNQIAIPLAQTGTKQLGSEMENQLLKEKQAAFTSTGSI